MARILLFVSIFIVVASCKTRNDSQVLEGEPVNGKRCPRNKSVAHCDALFHLANVKTNDGASYLFGLKSRSGPNGEEVLEDSHYGDLPVNRFGTFELMFPEDKGHVVTRDMHYFLNETEKDSDSRVGIRIIPLVDINQPPVDIGGLTVKGAELVDGYLRKIQGLSESDYLFAPVAFQHPEEWQDDLTGLKKRLKTENGMTHLGGYIGNGFTRNSPLTYQRFGLKIKHYPTMLYTVKLDYRGVGGFITPTQANFNKNAVVTLRVLNESNEGVKFPPDYKFDWFKTYNLSSTLDFYRAWLNHPDDIAKYKELHEKLINDPKWQTYCAEHITIAINVAVNLPQNERGYTEAYGADMGPKLWQRANELFKQNNEVALSKNVWKAHPEETAMGNAIPKVDYFTPLYKARKLNPTYGRDHRGLAWQPETTSDLVTNFIETYASWVDVGAVRSAAVLLGFSSEAVTRMGVSVKEYISWSVPVLQKTFYYEALTVGHPNSRLTLPAGSVPGIPTAVPLSMIAKSQGRAKAWDAYMGYVQAGLAQVAKSLGPLEGHFNERITNIVLRHLQEKKEVLLKRDAMDPEQARTYFRDAVSEQIRRLRDTAVTPGADGEKRVKYYSPPAVVYRITNNTHPSDGWVKINAVATLMDASEVRLISGKSEITYDIGERVKFVGEVPSTPGEMSGAPVETPEIPATTTP